MNASTCLCYKSINKAKNGHFFSILLIKRYPINKAKHGHFFSILLIKRYQVKHFRDFLPMTYFFSTKLNCSFFKSINQNKWNYGIMSPTKSNHYLSIQELWYHVPYSVQSISFHWTTHFSQNQIFIREKAPFLRKISYVKCYLRPVFITNKFMTVSRNSRLATLF